MRCLVRNWMFLLAAALFTMPAVGQQDVISTIIGGGPSDIPAIDANLSSPASIAIDATGNYYIAAAGQNRVFKVDTTGTLTVLAGNGIPAYGGDGVTGGAASAQLNNPEGVAVDGSGNVYISDTYNFVIRKVDTTNTITTIAGTQGACGGAANLLCYPMQIAADNAGNLFIADQSDCQVKKLVLSSNTMGVFAGTGSCGYTGNGGLATAAQLNVPAGVAVDSTGNVFIADSSNFVIREVAKSTGKISAIAGNNTNGFSGDGGKATLAAISYTSQLAVNSAGTTVTIADDYNFRIRQFTVGGNINTIAGSGGGGFCGDGGPATSACIYYPQGVAVASSGAVSVADTDNNRIRQFTVGGNISTAAGNGSATQPTVTDAINPLGTVLNFPWAVYEDPSGNILVADQSNNMVRELVQSSGLVDFFAGNGTYGFAGDSGAATAAELAYPGGVARDSSGNIYIADYGNCAIRMVTPGGTISTFAGTPPTCSYSGDGGPATSAALNGPYSVFVDSKNNVYIPDSNNHVVRVVINGTITTIAGLPGSAGYSGDGGPATSAMLKYPAAVAEDGAGNIYIADSYNCRIRGISAATGIIHTVAGNGTCGYNGDGPATEVSLAYPSGIAVDASGNMFIADPYNQLLRWVSTAGIMTTFAGVPQVQGYNGDGGPATAAELAVPFWVYEDSAANFLVSDQYNFRVRSVSAFAALNPSAGSFSFPLQSVGSTSAAQQLILTAIGPMSISNISISGDFSESDDCPASLPNGTNCTVYIYFVPKASGLRTGSLTINHNGFFNPVSSVSLQGTGTSILLTGAPVNFGNQLVKTTSVTKNVTIKNNGSTTITMGTITLNQTTDFAIASNNCPASGQTLAAKGSCIIGLTFTPQSTGAKKGGVIINDSDPTSPQVAGLSGTGTSNVSLTPASITFAAQAVGTTSTASKITLTNKSGVSLTLGTPAITTSGPFAKASTSTCTDGLVIANNGTCIINVTFTPTAVGYVAGSVSVSDSDVTSPQTVALSGTGSGVKFSPPSVNFGTVARGTQGSSTVTVSNVGATTVTFGGAELTGANSADFSSSNGNQACAASLKAGQNCTVTLYFTPTKVGAEKATYKVFDNSPGSPQSLSLSGTGQ